MDNDLRRLKNIETGVTAVLSVVFAVLAAVPFI